MEKCVKKNKCKYFKFLCEPSRFLHVGDNCDCYEPEVSSSIDVNDSRKD